MVKSGAPGARATRRAEPFLARPFERMLRPRRWALDTLATEELTEEEKRVLELLALGRGARDLAAELAMSPDTVRGHVQNILMKLGVHSRLEAAARAIRPDPPPLPPAASAALAVPAPPDRGCANRRGSSSASTVRLAITRGLIDCEEDRRLRAVLSLCVLRPRSNQ